MYKGFERRPTMLDEKIKQFSGKLMVEQVSESDEEGKSQASSKSGNSRRGSTTPRGGSYADENSPIKVIR